MQDDKSTPQTTLGDRVEAALKAAGEQAMRNSNMGQIEAYRVNHVISLIEQLRNEDRVVPRDLLVRLYRFLRWICGEGISPSPGVAPEPDDLYLELGAILNPEGKDARKTT